MQRSKCIRGVLAALFIAAACSGQTTTTDTPAPASNSIWSAGPIEFSGLVDGYYSFNFNHPQSRNNNLRNFDAKANQFSLNMMKITAEQAADPVGFRVDLGFGRAFDIFHAAEPGGIGFMRNVMQAYLSVKPASWHGFQFDFGKFVTSAGAEVTETHLNWNYSRSLLFANGPYYHFGARTSMPINKHLTAGVQLVNGWNNVEDNNTGKTVGFTTAVTTSKVNWFNNYYVGPEKTDLNKGIRHFYDTVIQVNPAGRVNFLVNFDYGQENMPGGRDVKFYGLSTAMRFVLGENWALSPRYDWYKDRDGFITAYGEDLTLQEFTLTFDYKLKEGFLSRFEYRRDSSSKPFFDRGFQTGNATSMNTLLAGFVVYFGPKR
jgi:hypothetical protein